MLSKNGIYKYKTAYISDQHYPIEKADSEQVVNTVAALAAEGVDIKLVIPKDWATFGIPKDKRNARIKEFYQLNNGFSTSEILQLPLSRLRVEKYSHGILAPIWAKLSGYQIVYTRNPISAIIAMLLGFQVIFETYRIHDSRLARYLSRLTNSPKFLAMITHSQPSKESLIKAGAMEVKVTVIHNGFNPTIFNKSISKQEARRKLGLNETQKIACYSGRLDAEKGIQALLELAGKTPEITFFFIGKTQINDELWIQEFAESKNFRNIKYLDWMPVDKLVHYLLAADVLLIPPTADPLLKHGKTVLPMKLFMYLAAGRTILAPTMPDMMPILNDRNAVLIKPDNLNEAAEKIRQIFAKPEWATRLAKQAYLDSKTYTWQNRARKIISFLNERLNYKDS